MKKFLCIIVALFIAVTLTTACGSGKQHVDRKAVAIDSESKKTELFVPIGLMEDKNWVEQNISINASTYNVDKIIRYVERFKKDGALPYKCKGVYNLASFEPENRIFYVFSKPNDFYQVMEYKPWKGFAFIIHNTGEVGVSIVSVSHASGKFCGLTKNCILFKEEDGSITAVHFKKKNSPTKVGAKEFVETEYDEIPQWEKFTAVYPVGWYTGDNDKDVYSFP